MAGMFSTILVLVTLASGAIWLLDALVFAPRRKQAIEMARSQASTEMDEETLAKLAPQPAVVELAVSIFPVIAVVLVLRSFLYEPFQIPSGSMMPTLLVGDFILVEKYAYGLREPLMRNKVLDTGRPERGDIAVFKYPLEPSIDYIKRVIGTPGDRVIYRDKQVYLKPRCEKDQAPCPPLQLVSSDFINRGEFYQMQFPLERRTEQLGENSHDILVNRHLPDRTGHFYPQPGLRRGEWLVPEGQYFVMGDNRDNSTDSRYWGFVKEDNLVGKAVAIWMSFEFERGEDSLLPGWVPSGVRLSRIGGIN
jgi:signal peptidase I